MNDSIIFPMTALALAINRYLVIGDAIGEAVAFDAEDTKVELPLLVNTNDPQQTRDFECLRSRLEEVAPELGVELVVRIDLPGVNVWGLRFDRLSVDRLIAALCERPGALGWGSPYAAVERCIRTGTYSRRSVYMPRRNP